MTTAFYITGIHNNRKMQLAGPFRTPIEAGEFVEIFRNQIDWKSCPDDFARSYPMPHHAHCARIYILENSANLPTWFGAGIGNFTDKSLF